MVRSQTLTDAFPYKVCVQEVHTKLRSLTLVINLPFIPALPRNWGENYNLNVKLKESSETLDEIVITAAKNEVQYGKDGCDNQYLLVTDHLFTHH